MVIGLAIFLFWVGGCIVGVVFFYFRMLFREILVFNVCVGCVETEF